MGVPQIAAFGRVVKSNANALGLVYTTDVDPRFGEMRTYPTPFLRECWHYWVRREEAPRRGQKKNRVG